MSFFDLILSKDKTAKHRLLAHLAYFQSFNNTFGMYAVGIEDSF